ncbi:hypothetical protein M3Y95_00786700 [Aphelenchoides besseyi]|nr:hypothetical protein M3Y95_00786700 [Aphelenchoides besseyi]
MERRQFKIISFIGLFIMNYILLLLLSSSVVIAKDILFNVRQLTTSGDHSHPQFSYEHKSIYFTAKGGQYETNCEHVYQLDLRTSPQPISLVSMGVGIEKGELSIFKNDSAIAVATAGLNLLQSSSPNFMNLNDLCQSKVCDRNELSAPTKRFCSQAHEERQRYTRPVAFDSEGRVRTSYDSAMTGWQNLPFYAENKRIAVMSSQNGEVLNYTSRDDKTLIDVEGWIGAFDQTGTQPLLFHGTYLAAADRIAVSEGVLPLTNAGILKATFEDLKNSKLNLQNYVIPPTADSYKLDPKYVHDGSTGFFYTKVDISSNTNSIYMHVGDQDVLVRHRAKQIDSVRINNINYVTFVAQDGTSSDYQVYLATLHSNADYPTYQEQPERPKYSPSLYVKNPVKLTTSLLGWSPEQMKISGNGQWLMYVINNQIYQLDLRSNTSNLIRKLSTGTDFFSSPCFTTQDGGTGDILVVSSISESSKCIADKINNLCLHTLCWDDDTKDLCQIRNHHYLSPYNQIYRINQFGTIKERLTNDNFHYGELAISPNLQNVIFSSNLGGDFDLYYGPVNSIKDAKSIVIRDGWEGGVQFAPNGQSFAFYAWYPNTETERALYQRMLKNNAVDMNRLNLYLYDFNTQQIAQLTDFKDQATWPLQYAFNSNGDKIYVKRDYDFFSIDVATKNTTQLLSLNDAGWFKYFAFAPNNDIFVSVSDRLYRGQFNANPSFVPMTTPSSASHTSFGFVALLTATFISLKFF